MLNSGTEAKLIITDWTQIQQLHTKRECSVLWLLSHVLWQTTSE